MDNGASEIQVVGRVDERGDEILTPGALAFVDELQRRFAARRDELLRRRRVRREETSRAGGMDFLPETHDVRTSEWTVAPAPVGIPVGTIRATVLRSRRSHRSQPTGRRGQPARLRQGARGQGA